MATMLCHRAFQPSVDSQFNFKSQFLPFEFLSFNSPFLHLDLHSPESLNQCQHQTAAVSVLPPPDSDANSDSDSDSDASAESVSPLATEEEPQPPYVHPLVKRSGSSLSEKSLAICTENLGNETGVAYYVEDDVFSDRKIERSPMRKRVKSDQKQFPPPLTTISGEDSICVRSYREDGRLIMAAVEAPSRLPCFHAERSHGRLRLSILKTTAPKVEEEEEEELRNDDVSAVGEKGNYEENVGVKVEENGNIGGAEIEIEKIVRTCRCKEAGVNNNNNIEENKNRNDILLLTRRESLLSIWVSTNS